MVYSDNVVSLVGEASGDRATQLAQPDDGYLGLRFNQLISVLYADGSKSVDRYKNGAVLSVSPWRRSKQTYGPGLLDQAGGTKWRMVL